MEDTSTSFFNYSTKKAHNNEDYSLTESELDEILENQLCAPCPHVVNRIVDYAKSTCCTKVDTEYLDLNFN